MKFSAFDLDLRFGQEGEQWLTILGREIKVEVKRERDKWKKTGNIAFEFRCSGKPSGLAVTKADYWVHVLSLDGVPEAAFIFRVEHLKGKLRAMLKEGRVRVISGGDRDAAEMILFPLKLIHELL